MAAKKETTPFTGPIKSIIKDGTDERHYYVYEQGKKFYKWKTVLEDGTTAFVLKLEEHGPVPFKVGDVIIGEFEIKIEKGKDGAPDKKVPIFRYVKQLGADGKPIERGTSKSTWNDPVVTIPKYREESIRRSIRILLKLLEWTNKAHLDNPAGPPDPFHLYMLTNENVFTMANYFNNWITQSGTEVNRDVVELRTAALDNAISMMDLPSYIHLKGNDEHQDANGQPVVDKTLRAKIIEQAQIFLNYAKEPNG